MFLVSSSMLSTLKNHLSYRYQTRPRLVGPKPGWLGPVIEAAISKFAPPNSAKVRRSPANCCAHVKTVATRGNVLGTWGTTLKWLGITGSLCKFESNRRGQTRQRGVEALCGPPGVVHIYTRILDYAITL
jgi:hypothetical protein